MPHSTSNLNDPQCPICKGIGWFQAPTYGDFEPRIEPVPCPECNPVDPIDKSGWAILTAFVVLVVFMIFWGAR